ncbi:MAG: hypothetical protein NY202_02720 [Mollicutes bacterium UO1]
MQIAFIEEKMDYVKRKNWHLMEEEREMETLSTTQETIDRRDKREKIRGLMKYLADLQISKEKIERKVRILSKSS